VAGDGSVTSEAQAYALLRGVWSGDRAGFDRTWQWTAEHLLTSTGLLGWRYQAERLDQHNATDADTDAALALLLASEQWQVPEYRTAGIQMLSAIWTADVAAVDGHQYVTAGDWAPALDVIAVNPSYFAPYAYHVFAQVDPDPSHDWTGVIDDGYAVLFAGSAANFGADRSAGLPPDWLGIDRSTGQILPLALDDTDTTAYGYDAPRTYWRLALDLRWNGDGRAAAYLAQAGFLRDEVTRAGDVRAVYSHAGTVSEDRASVVGTAGALAALLTLDPNAANTLFTGRLLGSVQHADATQAYWDDPSDLYAQEWGWFATALFADHLPPPTS
jgi:endo-1,4-beta-D-glucanase Y